MKWLCLFFLIVFVSCSLDDGNNLTYSIMPVEDVEMPEAFVYGEVHEIFITYKRPNGCHEFQKFIINPQENTRTIGVVDVQHLERGCGIDTLDARVTLNFKAITQDEYIFKFYQGKNHNGEDQFLVVEVPVVE